MSTAQKSKSIWSLIPTTKVAAPPGGNFWVKLYFGINAIWNEKLGEFQDYYNGHRVHQALNLKIPEEAAGKDPTIQADMEILSGSHIAVVCFRLL